MSGKGDVIYTYDGTFEGMLCCVWAAFEEKENPTDIWCFDEEQPTLYRLRDIETDACQAARVQRGIHTKLGAQAEQWVWDAYYSALPHRELATLEFLKLGFAKGPAVTSMLGHPQVAPLFSASRALHNEVHLLTGFIRFTQYDTVLVAIIRPKNFVLPFLEPHFSTRFPRENYLIYDETHRYALAASAGKTRLVQTDTLQLPQPTQEEARYTALWKQFYDTVAVQARHNPKCRMTHVPKRYWECMSELRGEKKPLPVSVQQALAAGELTLPQDDTRSDSSIATPTRVSLAAAQTKTLDEKKNIPKENELLCKNSNSLQTFSESCPPVLPKPLSSKPAFLKPDDLEPTLSKLSSDQPSFSEKQTGELCCTNPTVPENTSGVWVSYEATAETPTEFTAETSTKTTAETPIESTVETDYRKIPISKKEAPLP